MPYGQLPVLDVHGNMMGQSGAIARYVSREVGKSLSESADRHSIGFLCNQESTGRNSLGPRVLA